MSLRKILPKILFLEIKDCKKYYVITNRKKGLSFDGTRIES